MKDPLDIPRLLIARTTLDLVNWSNVHRYVRITTAVFLCNVCFDMGIVPEVNDGAQISRAVDAVFSGVLTIANVGISGVVDEASRYTSNFFKNENVEIPKLKIDFVSWCWFLNLTSGVF